MIAEHALGLARFPSAFLVMASDGVVRGAPVARQDFAGCTTPAPSRRPMTTSSPSFGDDGNSIGSWRDRSLLLSTATSTPPTWTGSSHLTVVEIGTITAPSGFAGRYTTRFTESGPSGGGVATRTHVSSAVLADGSSGRLLLHAVYVATVEDGTTVVRAAQDRSRCPGPGA